MIYGDGSESLRDADGLISYRVYHPYVWMTFWMYARDPAEADRVEDWLWRQRCRDVATLRDHLR